jgi:hypothetical protein
MYFTDLEDQRLVLRRDHDSTYDGHGLPILELERHLHVNGIGASFSDTRSAMYAPQLLHNLRRGLSRFWQCPCLDRDLSMIESGPSGRAYEMGVTALEDVRGM